jgi:hypothetical protein
MIKLVMTVVGSADFPGDPIVARDFEVKDDKAPGGYDRMVASAFEQAGKSGSFRRGCTLNIRSNWRRP